MSDKLENIESQDIQIDANGDVELSDDLQSAVAGGFSPESEEDEAADNTGCGNTANWGCGQKQLK